jgi:hypothetical protein
MIRSLAIAFMALWIVGSTGCAAAGKADVGAASGAGGSGGSGGGAGGTAGMGGMGGSGGGSLDVDGGKVDCSNPLDMDGCKCASPGTSRKCYVGAPAQAGVGVCTWGMQQCVDGNEGLTSLWGACLGSGHPTPVVCGDGLDHQCDGKIDEGCTCTAPTVAVTGVAASLACGATMATATLTFDEAVTGVASGTPWSSPAEDPSPR